MDKRSFLKTFALAGLAAPLTGSAMSKWIDAAAGIPAETLAADEPYWEGIRKHYLLKPDYINLENGYYNILPQEILEGYIQHIRNVNYQGSYYMRTVQFENKKAIATKVAALTGCNTEEFILTRNTTESLDMIIGGYPWVAGDEAIFAEQDYGAMIQMFHQVALRHEVVNKVLSIPNHPSSDEEIVNLYASAITPKTKLIMVSHMINITGQIMPVRKICDMAHAKGVEVMVDGAHAIAHIQFNIPDLHCDYYGASLHKWLAVPLGVGILYVQKDKINKIWPLLAEGPNIKTISRLNHLGTHPVHTDLAIQNAVEFYQQLGPGKKEARLRYLQQYWTSKVRGVGKVQVNTPAEPERACAIANVGIAGMKPALLAETLLKKYRIYTVAIDGANVHGCRITPNVFTTTAELDQLVVALKEMS
ncbi:MAG: aminotransferase class V-fold PLP-dependent enzyme [Sphingobacteriia bacterium]|nr:aminotransferase class V-fold PLP-dependent enzyme [Sphingobacteriia bacterium]